VETFGVPLLKTKRIPSSNLSNCEGWAKTGKTLKSFDTPGSGLYGKLTKPSGAHGLKWVNGQYWMAVPASGKIFLMEPETGLVPVDYIDETIKAFREVEAKRAPARTPGKQ
jgi:hypothetical protein